MTADSANPEHKPTHPLVYLVLITPFGIVAGYLTVTLAFLFGRAGISAEAIATLIGIGMIPHTWKCFWAPVVDTTLRRKTWYVIGTVIAALGLFCLGALPVKDGVTTLMISVAVLAQTATTLLGMATDSLMAYSSTPEEKGRAAGWFQAGNLGGSGLGGGAALWIAEHTSTVWLPGATMAVICLLCIIALRYVPEPALSDRKLSLWHNITLVGKDLWSVSLSRLGYLGLLICFLPIGTGAASNVFAAIAGEWQASADVVATVNGAMNGLVSAAGCLVGGYICDRLGRKQCYALFGFVLAVCAVAMAFAPRTQLMYVIFVNLYSFINGLCYAAFSAVVLEAIGKGAAATKYNVFASLSNVPIAYLTVANGWVSTHWGTGAMLCFEASAGVLGILLFALIAWVSRPEGRLAAGLR